jgi:hypothetical protein
VSARGEGWRECEWGGMWGRGTEEIGSVEEGFGEGKVGDNEETRRKIHDYRLDA